MKNSLLPEFELKTSKIGDQKCIGNRRRSLIELPSASRFLRDLENRVFQQLQPISGSLTIWGFVSIIKESGEITASPKPFGVSSANEMHRVRQAGHRRSDSLPYLRSRRRTSTTNEGRGRRVTGAIRFVSGGSARVARLFLCWNRDSWADWNPPRTRDVSRIIAGDARRCSSRDSNMGTSRIDGHPNSIVGRCCLGVGSSKAMGSAGDEDISHRGSIVVLDVSASRQRGSKIGRFSWYLEVGVPSRNLWNHNFVRVVVLVF